MKKYIFLAITFTLCISAVLVAQNDSEKKQTIFESLENSGNGNHGSVKVFQDKRIKQLVSVGKVTKSSQDLVTGSGFRLQIFSSNVQRTAKTEAFKIEKMIKEQFPDLGVYVNYTSPFWKVRVGDFKTHAQAQAFKSELTEVFPTLRKEAYVVREQIILSGSK